MPSTREQRWCPDACVIGTVAYRRGEEVGMVRSDEATLHVVRIQVVGVLHAKRVRGGAADRKRSRLLPDDETTSTVGRR